VLVVVPEAHAHDDLLLDLAALLPEGGLACPAWPRASGGTPPDVETLVARTQALARLRDARVAALAGRSLPLVVVASLAALLQPVPAPHVIDAAALALARGQQRAPATLLEHLALCGYVRVAAVEAPGEFAARGGVLDVWPLGRAGPVRLDFLGDEVESLREMDPTTQRSGTARDAVDLLVLPPERVRTPDDGGGAAPLSAHLPPQSLVVLAGPEALADEAARLGAGGGRESRQALSRLQAALHERAVIEAAPEPLGPAGDLDLEVGSADAIRSVAALRPDRQDRAALEPASRRTERIVEGFRALARRAKTLVIYRRAPGEQERLDELFREHAPGAQVRWQEGALTRSFVFGPTATAHVAYDDLVDLPVRERRPGVKGPRQRPLTDVLELEPNLPVVHMHHGIGIFRGLVTLDGPDGPGEFLRLSFAEGTTVYVPVARIDLVQRYVGTGARPRLSKLGGTDWTSRTKDVVAAVEELAEELLAMQAARARRHGAPLPPDGRWQQEFERAFPHALTPDQESAVRAVKADLESGRPMDRLLCGDVGYGKTEVALRALFKVLAAGRQAAVLVPTKVLCEQHVRTFAQRLGPYPLRVRALSSLHGAAANRGTLDALAAGTVDLVVGTHRLLSKDVRFKNLGLIVVDEEQRFGVKHKERLKALRAEVDVLTLSATPIPRTLHMALLGIKDISNLTTPPLGRHPIQTEVRRESPEAIEQALRRELTRGGQAFLVSSRIAELPVVATEVLERIPEVRVAAIHGRMEKEQVESRMLRFVRGEVDVLLATTIIESGLDIPNANTIVIRDADRYGLSELHQLRGRVGREHRHAHALLLLPERRTINPEARERLRAIEEYSELGAGFRIAMRDLEIRGAGNLLGAKQSGHIADVGYDLYCKLLAEAVRRARGLGPPPPTPAYLAIDLPAGVPDAWVSDEREKFRLLRRVSATETPEDLQALVQELLERFGPPPPEVERLLLAQEVRIVAGHAGFSSITGAERPGAVLTEVPGARGIERLLARGVVARKLTEDRVFVPLEAASGAEATVRRLLAALRG
jgi:transcription-repair coupling factor (superfamily II helicase)